MDAPRKEDVLSLIESAREVALVERRRWNLVVDRTTRLGCAWIAFTDQYLITESHGFPTCGSFTRA